ncbi:Crossover junction endonuclease mus81 [Linnemannia hyalina]|uniref:Crossover junction endonuclease MUS81 n=1 Tax=Linnemannia hyalina TaxID=64524 RepID=A0A9P8BRT7_9FUNG|nr:Crossover junction endonuclease mus81 [Linnemannia hyalina]
MPVYGKKGRRQAGAVPLTPADRDEPKSKKPRKASAKPYVPRYRSGSFAILLALLEAEVQHNQRSLTRDEILITGQKFAEHSLANKAHGTFYSGWDSMKTLTGKGLVYQNGKDYHMTGEGRDTAWQLRDVGIALDPSLEQYFVRPNGEAAINPDIRNRPPPYAMGDASINPNLRDRSPSYSPEPSRATSKQPRPTPKSKAAPKRAAPTYNDYDTNDSGGPSNGQGYGDWDDPDDDWGTSAPAPAASGSAPMANPFTAGPSNSFGSSSSSFRPTGISHEPFDVNNDWDDNEYDARSPNGYTSPLEDVSRPYSGRGADDDQIRSTSSSTSLSAKANVPAPLPDLSRVPMPVLLEIVEAQRRGTVSEFLDKGASGSILARSSSYKGSARSGAPRSGPDAFPHLSVNTFSTTTGDDGPTVDIAQLAKFQPNYYKPGSFDITLVLDVREVRVQGDRDYISNKLREKGVDVETRALDIGDVIWIAKPKEPSPLLPREIVLDHIVERKRMDDLVSSIKDGRFNEQKFRLSRSGIGHVVYVLETYKANETFGGIPVEAIRTAMTTIQVHSGFFLKRTVNTDQTIDYLVALTKTLKAKYLDQVLYTIPDAVIDRDSHLDLIEYLKGKFPGRTYLTSYDAFMKLNSKSDTLTVRDNFVKMLMVIRGVSAEKAIELARVYGTPRAMFSALAELGRDASNDERRDMLAKSVSQIGRKKLGNALAGKVAELWYSKEYDDPAAPPRPTYGS